MRHIISIVLFGHSRLMSSDIPSWFSLLAWIFSMRCSSLLLFPLNSMIISDCRNPLHVTAGAFVSVFLTFLLERSRINAGQVSLIGGLLLWLLHGNLFMGLHGWSSFIELVRASCTVMWTRLKAPVGEDGTSAPCAPPGRSAHRPPLSPCLLLRKVLTTLHYCLTI